MYKCVVNDIHTIAISLNLYGNGSLTIDFNYFYYLKIIALTFIKNILLFLIKFF